MDSVLAEVGLPAAFEDFGSGGSPQPQGPREAGFGRLYRRPDLELDLSAPWEQ